MTDERTSANHAIATPTGMAGGAPTPSKKSKRGRGGGPAVDPNAADAASTTDAASLSASGRHTKVARTSASPASSGATSRAAHTAASASSSSSSSSAKAPPGNGHAAVLIQDGGLPALIKSQLEYSVFALILTYQNLLEMTPGHATHDPGPEDKMMARIFPPGTLAKAMSPEGLQSTCVSSVVTSCVYATRSLLDSARYGITAASPLTKTRLDHWLGAFLFNHLSKSEPDIARHWEQHFGHNN